MILVNKFLGIQSNYKWWIKKIFILSVSKISFNYVWCLLLQYCAFIYLILSFLLWLFSWELSVLLWPHGGKVPPHVDTWYHWPKTGACRVLQTCSWYFLSGFFNQPLIILKYFLPSNWKKQKKNNLKDIIMIFYLLDLANKMINEIISHTGNYDFLAFSPSLPKYHRLWEGGPIS